MKKTVEHYLALGFDEKMAEYFSKGRKKLTDVKPNEDFTLTLTYDDKEKRLFDMKPFLQKNTVFEQFSDYSAFKRVYIDDTNSICWDKDPSIDSNIDWSNKVDMCPDSCYVDSIEIF